MIEEVWEGRIIEAGGAYRLKLEFTAVDGEICRGLATSINATFYCETSFTGVYKDGVLILSEEMVTNTNFPSRDNICLLKLTMRMKKNEMAGSFTSNSKSPTSKCGNGTATLKLVPKPKQLPVANKDNAGKDGVKKNVTPKPFFDSVYIDDGQPIDVVIDDAQVRLPKRDVDLISTFDFNEDSVHLEIYDNSVVDGDEITLYINNEIRFDKVRLTEKPLELDLTKKRSNVFDIRFHANSLGSIPPNTGLIVIRSKTTRKEVNFSSDFTKTSSVRIRLKG